MISSKTHKHVRIGNWVYGATQRTTDSRYWDCGSAWGPSPESAAREAHKHDVALRANSVAELHELEQI